VVNPEINMVSNEEIARKATLALEKIKTHEGQQKKDPDCIGTPM
jgi:hypothetical protein